MAESFTISWWGLRRRPPRFWQPPKVSPWEAVGLASPFACLLVLAGWLFQLHCYDEWVARLQFPPGTYLKFFAWLYAAPLLLSLIAWGIGFFKFGDVLDVDGRENNRFILGLVLRLRECKALRTLDSVLVVVPVVVVLACWYWRMIEPLSEWRNWPLFFAGLLTSLLLRSFRTNPFIPSARSLKIPDWVKSLADGKDAGGASKGGGFPGIVPPDEETDPPNYVQMKLPDNDLPEELRLLGVQLRSGLRQHMEETLGRIGPTYFKRNKYLSSLEMIDPATGPLKGEGAVELRRLAAQVLTRANHAGWGKLRMAEILLHMVQDAITYRLDKDSTGHSDYGRFPLQTLADGVGDCEDSALLLCALLSNVGIECALLITETEESGHAAVALKVAEKEAHLAGSDHELLAYGGALWLYGETAIDGGNESWGRLPLGHRIVQVIPVPVAV